MELNNPKHRLVFVISLAVGVAIVFVLVGYFSAKSVYKVKPTPTPTATIKPSPSPSATSSLGAQIEKLKAEKAALQTKLDEANSNLDSKNSGIATTKAYVSFLEYMTQVIDAHDGFTGWTNAEYQVGREKAEATGNSDFVNRVDWAWNETSVDSIVRVIEVYRDIVSGINSALD
ncbi:MAG: hypothetical protein ABH810_00095 [bacterium]